MGGSSGAEAVTPRSGLSVAQIALGIAALAALIALGRWGGGYVPVFARWVEGIGVWGPVVFMVGYAAAVVAFVPASLLTLAAGAVFGLVEGTLYTFIAVSQASKVLLAMVTSSIVVEAVRKSAIRSPDVLPLNVLLLNTMGPPRLDSSVMTLTLTPAVAPMNFFLCASVPLCLCVSVIKIFW